MSCSKFNDEELSDLNGDYDQLVEQLGPKYGYNAAMKLKTMWINLLRIHGIKFNSSIPRSSS